jgi:Rps23 Pro-64 3,4-dihydroxylase Tpa1-like proline 4-hydroxylase
MIEPNYFYINQTSISQELCKIIINMFDSDKNKYEGLTFGGLNKNVKDTQDLVIPNRPDKTGFDKWNKINKFLEKELAKNTKEYVKILDNVVNLNHEKENTDSNYTTFGSSLSNESFMVQRYTKQKGRYIYHHDFRSDYEQKKYRVITFLWYLNTVEEGGETEFWGTHTIKPEAGKLLLFPASWTFPHRGKMPLSHDKYIITGWLYLHEE